MPQYDADACDCRTAEAFAVARQGLLRGCTIGLSVTLPFWVGLILAYRYLW